MKKLISICLVLMLLIIPFNFLLNVKADPLQIQVYDDKPKSDLEQESKQIKNLTNIIVRDIGYSEKNNTFDQLKAYKILNAYYNSNTREISYNYTDDFKSFLDDYDSTMANDISKYFSLTSDGNYGSGSVAYLVSKYAMYISSHNVSSVPLTSKKVNGNPIAEAEVEVGVYLIIPSSLATLVPGNVDLDIDNLIVQAMTINSYGVMIANAIIGIDNDNWTLDDVEIVAKKKQSVNLTGFSTLTSGDLSYSGDYSEEEVINKIRNYFNSIQPSMNVSKDKEFSYASIFNITSYDSNYNESYINYQEIIDKMYTMEVVLPIGVDFDIYCCIDGFAFPVDIVDGHMMVVFPGDVEATDVGKILINNNEILVEGTTSLMGLQFDLRLNHNIAVGEDANVFKTTTYYFDNWNYDVDTAVNNAKNQGMSDKEAIESVMNNFIKSNVVENTITTYGVKVFATSSDQSIGNLVDADYVVCKDINCTEQVSDQFSFSEYNNQVFGSFIGLSGETDYYLKQTKAPSGHKIYNKPIKLLAKNSQTNPDDDNIALGQNGYYELTIVNEKQGLLPFTGGIGTILYIVIGLLIVILAFVIFIQIRKDKAEVKEEGMAKLD